jgi:hypothetical protein
MAVQNEAPDIRSGNDATSGEPPESPVPLRPLHPPNFSRIST